jgi:predicted LPLAT superfamily acyltransferase
MSASPTTANSETATARQSRPGRVSSLFGLRRRVALMPRWLQGWLTWPWALAIWLKEPESSKATLGRSIRQALNYGPLRGRFTSLQYAHASLCYGLDTLRLLSTDPAVLAQFNRQQNRFDGLDHLRSALEQGRGAIVAATFFSCFYYGLICPWPTGYEDLRRRRIHLVVPGLDNAMESALAVVRSASERQIELIEMGWPSAALLVARALKSGDLVICLIDNVPDGAALVPGNFFGRPACHPAGFALLATRLRSPVLVCGTQRLGSGFVTWFDAPLLTDPERPDEDLDWLVERMAARVESRVRDRPGAWTSWPSLSMKWEMVKQLTGG